MNLTDTFGTIIILIALIGLIWSIYFVAKGKFTEDKFSKGISIATIVILFVIIANFATSIGRYKVFDIDNIRTIVINTGAISTQLKIIKVMQSLIFLSTIWVAYFISIKREWTSGFKAIIIISCVFTMIATQNILEILF